MATVRLDLAYDGTGFHGWARQRGLRTVQGVLEDALHRALRTEVALVVAGRTDAGVHARGQVASFVTDAERVRDLARASRAVNGMVGPEIALTALRVVPDTFHARFSATAREYRYRIHTAEAADPFGHRFSWYRPGPLDVPRMRAAAALLIGEHDFAAFCRRPEQGGTVRDLQRLTVIRRGDEIEVGARANAFLHQMVRSLVRVLVEVGRGHLEPAAVGALLRGRDRAPTPGPAPAQGLTLERVVYGRRPLTRTHPRR